MVKATVDLFEVLGLMLTWLEKSASELKDSSEEHNQEYNQGRETGVRETAELVRSLLALPSVKVDESEPAA